ncbi:MAG: hypothetical protein B9S38_16525 [Verrucomicrobiia bacterium Tous-C4TDCM]|nr:MAG: hypothetical protein B9S38_16525 [Verrucomicrobiae bacterium Tous-C4TDCM]
MHEEPLLGLTVTETLIAAAVAVGTRLADQFVPVDQLPSPPPPSQVARPQSRLAGEKGLRRRGEELQDVRHHYPFRR